MNANPRRVWVAGASDIGNVRSRNEDGLWLGDQFLRTGTRTAAFDVASGQGLIVAVADGVGGAAAGDVASRFVLERFAAGVEAAGMPVTPDALRAVAREVNDALNRRGVSNPEQLGMATTLTGLFLSPAQSMWFNAGDSRLYAVASRFEQVSRDHTLRELMGDSSIPGNIIANCFGGHSDFFMDVVDLDIDEAGCLLLCSDGVSDYANPTDFERTALRSLDAESVERLGEVAVAVVDAALAGGGGDNATCALVRIVPS